MRPTTQTPLLPRGTHLVFLGDSLLRYEYTALAFAHRFAGDDVTLERMQSLLYRRVDFSWNEYLNLTNSMLAPHEFCDCYRNFTESPLALENRFFSDSRHDVHLTYLSYSGSHASVLHGAW